MEQSITLPPGEKFNFDAFDPAYTSGLEKAVAKKLAEDNVEQLNDLLYRLFAERKRSVLLVLQGMDTSGKDGTLRQVMKGVSPQSCTVTSFRAPTEEELAHDFLWRVHQKAPPDGVLGIFNRSHYEDVLVARVRKLVDADIWRKRYDQINDFERILTLNGTTILKCFLYISKHEQRKRLQERIDDPDKRWKLEQSDFEDHRHWDEYCAAYEDALTRCNTEYALWHVIPADHKWHRNWLVGRLLRETLERMDPQYPPPRIDLNAVSLD
jgi:PPK2 family polyphosphate:nucleotide phosphotransferase